MQTDLLAASPLNFPNPLPKSWILSGLFFILLVGGQLALFHHHAVQEVIWAYPCHCDQAVYLERAYDAHLRMDREGFWKGLRFGSGFDGGDPSPNGAIMHVQAACMFFIFGSSRYAALALVFIYFSAFQAMFLSTLHSLTRSWGTAWMGLGLLLAARTTFQDTGGIMDFRPDFPAMCLYGIFVCCVMRSNVFQRPGWSVAAGVVAAFTMAFRFLTLAYFIPIFVLLLATLIVCVIFSGRRAEAKRCWGARVRNLCITGGIGSILLGPVLVHHKGV